MTEKKARQFRFRTSEDGKEVVEIAIRGKQVLDRPMTNFSTAYTLEQREALGLTGLLPPAVTSLQLQMKRLYSAFSRLPTDLDKHVFMTQLQDRNEIAFHAMVAGHLDEMMPIIYTPTIGEAIQQFSNWFTVPRGVFLSIDQPEQIESALRNTGQDADDVDLLVVTDSEGILGIGDQGVGGIRIAIGKLAVYTAAAGMHPLRVLPVVLDVGTDNLDLLNDPGYLGVRHARVRGERYDEFVDAFVKTASRIFPRAMLHWEDFGASNAHRVLNRYRDEVCSFNDDIQGTAAIVVAAVLASVKESGQRLKNQRIVVHGAGTAGVGIADLLKDVMMEQGLSEEEARSRFYCLGSRGLLVDGMKMRDFQEPYARPAGSIDDWDVNEPGRATLAEVVHNVQPTILIGTSGRPGSFTEQIVRDMAEHVERPIILPLSNPTSLSEALPSDLIEWTEGRALIATGSPFKPVQYKGTEYAIAQANNALVFPGIGLGAVACQAERITDRMISAAAQAVADMTTMTKPGDRVLPAIDTMRTVSARVAVAVAKAAAEDGVAEPLENPLQEIWDHMWQPEYPDVVAVTNQYTRDAKGLV